MGAPAVKKKPQLKVSPPIRPPRKRPVVEEEKKAERSAAAELIALVLVVGAIFLAVSVYSQFRIMLLAAGGENLMGPLGGRIAELLIRYFGWCAGVSVLWAVLLARSIWTGKWSGDGHAFRHTLETLVGSGLLALSAASLFAVFFGTDGGGLLGTRIAWKLIPHVNVAGAALLSLALFSVSLVLSTGVSGTEIVSFFRVIFTDLSGAVQRTLGVSTVWGARLARIQFRAAVLLTRLGFQTGARWVTALSRASRGRGEVVRVVTPELVVRREPTLLPAVVSKGSRKKIKEPEPVVEEEEEIEEEYEEEEFEEEEELEEEELPPPPRSSKLKSAGESLKKRLTGKKEAPPTPKVTRQRVSSFEMPPLNLLVQPDSSGNLLPKKDELQRNCRQLEQTLLDFKLGGKIVEADPGPVITLYQFEPAAGVKVNRIITLADDLALALKVASVRVYAPVPGKGTVGIEVPNAHREIVRLRDLLSGDLYQNDDSQLTLALGKDTAGDPYVADLGKMPHLLIAGATGTGKSVCINSLLLSLLYRNSPEEMRLILIDPKMLELSCYEGIPHLKAPVVTNPKRARGVLWWAVEEMERRYRLMMDLGVRNLDGYNKAVAAQGESRGRRKPQDGKIIELVEQDVIAVADPQQGVERAEVEETPSKRLIIQNETPLGEPLPRIVIVVDELADLMLTVGREVEELVTRLAQKARASGIHLILATQRPSVDVITGLIKANFPARISFKVASRIDARTVMDASGAEKLLGQGDMLFMTGGAGRPKRIHSAFVSDSEVTDVCEWLRDQGDPDYDPQIEEMIARMEELEKGAGGGGGTQQEFEFDPLYDQALNFVLERGQASTSMVQRQFRIGYNRAARIVDQMEREGVVGPADGAKPRTVLGRDMSLER